MSGVDVKWLANLSKIAFDEEESARMAADMGAIMDLMDTLKDVRLPQNEAEAEGTGLDGLRADVPGESLDLENISLAQDAGPGVSFSIPRIVE